MEGLRIRSQRGTLPPLPPTADISDIQLYGHDDYCSRYEWVEMYRPGGYHPMDIGDILDGRYEVIAKLGWGSSSTVWLCWDQKESTWRALKIMTAERSGSDLS